MFGYAGGVSGFYLAYLCYQFAHFFACFFTDPLHEPLVVNRKPKLAKEVLECTQMARRERERERREAESSEKEREKSGFKRSVKRSTQCCVHGAERL